MRRVPRSALGYMMGDTRRRVPPSMTTIRSILDVVLDRGVPPGPLSRSDAYGTLFRNYQKHKARWIPCVSQVDRDPYSIVGIGNGTENSDQATLIVGDAEGALELAANEDYPLFAGQEGWVRLIGDSSPVRARVRAGKTVVFHDRLSVWTDGSVEQDPMNDLMSFSYGESASDADTDHQARISILYRPVWSFFGRAVNASLKNENILAVSTSKGNVTGIHTPMGDVAQNDYVFVGWDDDAHVWIAVQRPCPGGGLS